MKIHVFCVLGMLTSICVGADFSVLRFDGRESFGGRIATGTEIVGSVDGTSSRTFDTTALADGWTEVSSSGICQPDGATVDLCVLNGPAIEGGRLVADAIWDSDRVHVVRDNVVIPDGVTLTLGYDCVVKFTDGARIYVEGDGRLVSQGAILTDIAEDSVGGDTNHDGDASVPSGYTWWDEDDAVAALQVVSDDDGLERVYSDESQEDGTCVKTATLHKGWNWISVNVEPTDATFASVFRGVAFADGDVIKSSDGSATYSGGTWHPNPATFKLAAGRAYAVKKSTAGTATVTVVGTAVPAEIAVAAGWNWIGPTATSPVPIEDLVHTGGFTDGDIINSPSASATYHGGKWYGDLETLEPGSGYKARFGKAGTLR